MEDREAKKLFVRHFKKMRAALYLNDWTIDVEYCKLPPGFVGECIPEPGYKRATIKIDPTEIGDESDFLRILRHELLHVVTSPRQTFRKACYELTPSSCVDDALDVVYRETEERIVGLLEAILDHNEVTTDFMVGRRKDGKA